MRPPYPDYTESEMESIGAIPSHWETRRLRTLAAYRTSSVDKKSAPDEAAVRLCNYTDVYYRERILAGDDNFMHATASAQEIDQFGLEIGDVLITKDSEDWSDIAVPAVVEETANDFVCGYHLGIIRPGSHLEPAFLFRALQSQSVNVQLQTAATGVTRFGVTRGGVGRTVVPLPPMDEQRSISAFLDSETARIDKLITKQELLIERLDEYRTALVTKVVTKGLPPEAAEAAGLDPAPALKDSGVEWLGGVPEHWEIKSLVRAVIFQRGHDLPNDVREPGTVPVVSSAGVSGHHAEAAATGPAIVTGRYGSIGDFYVIDGPFWPLNTSLYSIDLRGNDVMFLIFMLRSIKPLFIANAAKSAVPGVDRNDIHGIQVAIPGREEQEAIAGYLKKMSERIDALRAKAELSIERLSEYRSALVSAAVTGKIDVREAALAGSGGGG